MRGWTITLTMNSLKIWKAMRSFWYLLLSGTFEVLERSRRSESDAETF
jgi:hypothetical protein